MSCSDPVAWLPLCFSFFGLLLGDIAVLLNYRLAAAMHPDAFGNRNRNLGDARYT